MEWSTTITIASFIFFTGLVGLLTWLLTRRDRHDTSANYFLAGRSLTAGYIAGSLMLTNLSTEQLVGLNGAAFTDGLCVMAWEVIAGMSLVVMALFFLPRYLRTGIATVPQFLEERFDAATRTITSIIFIIAYAAILLPIILYTGATGLAGILDLQNLLGIESRTTIIWVTVWFIGIVGSIYAIFGGLRTVAVSDTINGFGLLTGGILIAWLALQAINPEAPIAALETVREAHPQHFNSIGGSETSVPFSTLFTGVLLLNLFYWCTNQQIIQRTFGASSLAEGQKGILLAGVLKVLAPIILVLPGILAWHMHATGMITMPREPVVAEEGADQPETDPAEAEGAGEPVSEMSNGEGTPIADAAYGTLVRLVLPHWLTGFFAAVVVGAILSSFNSALNSTATLFSLGVYRDLFHPDARDEQVIRSGKIFGWIVAIASMTVAPMLIGQKSIFEYLQAMNGLYFIPIFSVVLVGMLSRRVPPIAAKLALVLGFTVIAVGYFVPPAMAVVEKLHGFHFLGLVFALLVAMMLLIGLIQPLREPWIHRTTQDVDLTPWKGTLPVGLALIAFILGVYIYFADFSVVDWPFLE